VFAIITAEHMKMARAQRALHQEKVDEAVADAKARRPHSERQYTFVVDYGQNGTAIYNKERPRVRPLISTAF
jgi:hypothetical protein